MEPSAAKPTLKLGKEALDRADGGAAETILRSYLEEHPHDYMGTVMLGKACFLGAKYDDALVLYERAASANPTLRPAFQGIIETCARCGGLERHCKTVMVASEQLLDLLSSSTEPKDAEKCLELRVLLAEAYLRAGALRKAGTALSHPSLASLTDRRRVAHASPDSPFRRLAYRAAASNLRYLEMLEAEQVEERMGKLKAKVESLVEQGILAAAEMASAACDRPTAAAPSDLQPSPWNVSKRQAEIAVARSNPKVGDLWDRFIELFSDGEISVDRCTCSLVEGVALEEWLRYLRRLMLCNRVAVFISVMESLVVQDFLRAQVPLLPGEDRSQFWRWMCLSRTFRRPFLSSCDASSQQTAGTVAPSDAVNGATACIAECPADLLQMSSLVGVPWAAAMEIAGIAWLASLIAAVPWWLLTGCPVLSVAFGAEFLRSLVEIRNSAALSSCDMYFRDPMQVAAMAEALRSLDPCVFLLFVRVVVLFWLLETGRPARDDISIHQSVLPFLRGVLEHLEQLERMEVASFETQVFFSSLASDSFPQAPARGNDFLRKAWSQFVSRLKLDLSMLLSVAGKHGVCLSSGGLAGGGGDPSVVAFLQTAVATSTSGIGEEHRPLLLAHISVLEGEYSAANSLLWPLWTASDSAVNRFPPCCADLARCLLELGEVDAFVTVARRALQLMTNLEVAIRTKPTSAVDVARSTLCWLHRSLSLVSVRRGEWPGACEELFAATLLDPLNETIGGEMIAAHEQGGQMSLLASRLRQVVVADPNALWCWRLLAEFLLMRDKQWDAAIRCLQNVLRLEGDAARAMSWLLLGYAYLMRDQPLSSLRCLRKSHALVQAHPSSLQEQRPLSGIWAVGDNTGCPTTVSESFSMHPLFWMAVVELRMGRPHHASEMLADCRRLFPQETSLLYFSALFDFFEALSFLVQFEDVYTARRVLVRAEADLREYLDRHASPFPSSRYLLVLVGTWRSHLVEDMSAGGDLSADVLLGIEASRAVLSEALAASSLVSLSANCSLAWSAVSWIALRADAKDMIPSEEKCRIRSALVQNLFDLVGSDCSNAGAWLLLSKVLSDADDPNLDQRIHCCVVCLKLTPPSASSSDVWCWLAMLYLRRAGLVGATEESRHARSPLAADRQVYVHAAKRCLLEAQTADPDNGGAWAAMAFFNIALLADRTAPELDDGALTMLLRCIETSLACTTMPSTGARGVIEEAFGMAFSGLFRGGSTSAPAIFSIHHLRRADARLSCGAAVRFGASQEQARRFRHLLRIVLVRGLQYSGCHFAARQLCQETLHCYADTDRGGAGNEDAAITELRILGIDNDLCLGLSSDALSGLAKSNVHQAPTGVGDAGRDAPASATAATALGSNLSSRLGSVLSSLGEALLRLGQPEHAAEAFTRALGSVETLSQVTETGTTLMSLYLLTGETAAARQVAEVVAASCPAGSAEPWMRSLPQVADLSEQLRKQSPAGDALSIQETLAALLFVRAMSEPPPFGKRMTQWIALVARNCCHILLEPSVETTWRIAMDTLAAGGLSVARQVVQSLSDASAASLRAMLSSGGQGGMRCALQSTALADCLLDDFHGDARGMSVVLAACADVARLADPPQSGNQISAAATTADASGSSCKMLDALELAAYAAKLDPSLCVWMKE